MFNQGLRVAVNEHIHEQLTNHLVDLTRAVAEARREIENLKRNQEELLAMLEEFLPVDILSISSIR